MNSDTKAALVIIGLACGAGILGWLHESKRVNDRTALVGMVALPSLMATVFMLLAFWGDWARFGVWALGGLGLVFLLSMGGLLVWGVAEHRDWTAGYRILFLGRNTARER